MNALRRIDMVVTPQRDKPRVYAIAPLTVGPKAFKLFEKMVREFEAWARRQTVTTQNANARE
jgi:hypothetical protein